MRVGGALVGTAVLTAAMWTDSPTTWWSSIIDFLMDSNSQVTSTVMEVRPGGDLDLHVALWAIAGVLWWWALRAFRTVVWSLATLALWAMIVETLQPAFTEIRDRQFGDYVGNFVGVGLVAVAVVLRERHADGPMSPAT